MNKTLGWALLCAALLGWGGTANAELVDLPGLTGPDDIYSDIYRDIEYECEPACECLGTWRENTTAWMGADVYKSLGERITNINGGTGALTASFGAVAGFNTGFALGDSNIRGQVGASYGIYDFKGRLGIVPTDIAVEEQSFVTLGVYKVGDMLHDCDPISWGVVFDNFHANQWGVNANTVDLGQFRGIFGYAVNQCTEVGVWGTFQAYNDRAAATVAGAPGVLSTIRASNQANLYLRRNFEFGGEVMAYVGFFDSSSISSWQFGVNALAPLSYDWSLYSNFNYVAPSSNTGAIGSGQEQFNAGIGLVYYFGGKAVNPTVSKNRGLPLLNVANNGSFLITD